MMSARKLPNVQVRGKSFPPRWGRRRPPAPASGNRPRDAHVIETHLFHPRNSDSTTCYGRSVLWPTAEMILPETKFFMYLSRSLVRYYEQVLPGAYTVPDCRDTLPSPFRQFRKVSTGPFTVPY